MGYDVWLLNTRGNQYSTHKTLNKVNDESQFYNYTWQQKGDIDIPDELAFIKTTTGVEKIILWTTGQSTTAVMYGQLANAAVYQGLVSVIIANNPCFINK